MMLLIIGAGQFGAMVKEIAEESGKYQKISFLDDRNDDAIGKIDEMNNFTNYYEEAMVAIGDPVLRLELIERLERAGYRIATVISKSSYVSPGAEIGPGTVIEPMATVQTNVSIGKGCIVSSGAVIRHNSVLSDGCHADCNSVVPTGIRIKPMTKIDILQTVKEE